MNAHLSMLQTIQAGAVQTVAADPAPLAQTKSQRTNAMIDELVARLGPPPVPAPLPPMGGGDYMDAPCINPRARYQPTDHCMCGYHMGAHPHR